VVVHFLWATQGSRRRRGGAAIKAQLRGEGMPFLSFGHYESSAGIVGNTTLPPAGFL